MPIGEQVRLVRTAKNMSQVELSNAFLHLRDRNGLVSKIENDRISPDSDVLTQLARALDVSPSFLQQGCADALATRPWLRAYADASARRVESVLADNLLHHGVMEGLGVRRMPARIPRFDADANDDEAIEDFALEVRQAADVPDGNPVGNAIRAAERLGCVVLPIMDELGRHLGLSQYVSGTPYVRVSRPRVSVPGDRQRFTVCHELGHLCLHASRRPPETAEETRLLEAQAHRFAGAFLIPRDDLFDDLRAAGGRVTLRTLMDLKARWGVAIKMLVVRLSQLGMIEDAQAQSLYKQISRRGWNTGEPVPVSCEEPLWLAAALRQRYPGRDSVAAASMDSGIGLSHFERWLSWAPVDTGEPEASPGSSLASPISATITDLNSRRNRRA